MALTCDFATLSTLDRSDLDSVQALLDACLSVLLSPVLWAWLIGLTLVCALVGAGIGWVKGRTMAGLLWGVVLGPLGWLIIALSRSNLVECPQCSRTNRSDARVCRHCGVDFRKLEQKTARSELKGGDTRSGW
ncbi:MAG: hypothetical protein ABIY56_08200 [Dokdonella sp.]